MCQIQKPLQVTLTANELVECIDEMHESLTPDERMQLLEAIVPNRSEIIELMRLNKETKENAHLPGSHPACWSDNDLYKMINIMFNPRGILSKGQLAACVNEVIYNNY